MDPRPTDVLESLAELERAFEEFRRAYAAWLASEGSDPAALTRALELAERRLDAAREALARSDERARQRDA